MSSPSGATKKLPGGGFGCSPIVAMKMARPAIRPSPTCWRLPAIRSSWPSGGGCPMSPGSCDARGENIARRANAEDGCTGRFFEGRYKAQVLLDEASLLAWSAYVDLNPIRAAMAESPETSDYTGAKERIDDLAQRPDRSRMSTHQWERHGGGGRSGWMSPVEIDEASDPSGPCPCPGDHRGSDKGFLSLSLERYLELLDWTGLQLRAGEVGAIASHFAPILSRIGLDGCGWCDVVSRFGRIFKRAAGTPQSLAGEAIRRGQHWLCAPENPLGLSSI